MDKNDIKNIAEIKEREIKNYNSVKILSSYLNHCPRLITDEIMNEITGGDNRFDEPSFAVFLAEAFCEDESIEREVEREFRLGIKKLNAEVYKNNPYYKNIKIEPQGVGNCTLGYQTYEPYEGFVCDEITCRDDYSEIVNIGFFGEKFSFPAVFENGVEWMAIKPNEIETMKEPIEKSNGKVITFGLGMGYFAYMASEKENVTSVTVVEQNENVIKLFEKNILPQFSRKEKIKIVKSDAFDFLKRKMNDGVYDFAFFDLWHDVSDGTEMYIKLKKLEPLFNKTQFSYWIEKSILAFIRWKLFDKLTENYQHNNELSYEQITQVLSLEHLKKIIKFI